MRRILLAFIIFTLLVSSAACSSPVLEASEGELNATVYADDQGCVKRLEIRRGDRKLSTLRVDSTIADNGSSFEFIDINFDSHPDVRLLTSRGEHCLYTCYLYSPETDSFVLSDALSSMLDLAVDSENKQLTAYYSRYTIEPAGMTWIETYVDERGTSTFVWQQEQLTEIARECITYYSESDIYCVASWSIDAYGELSPTSERWMEPTKLISEGYTPFN